ncbi:inorganic diphosphatase [Paraburkholderia terrae]|uniref:inorganic diphosphatase n=1 Tax=Paraburkholderia terrae TaxID=311230 RepID=UPI00296ACA18|nr:inorganic diphosphatase [Paraburkholderia terrae]MDW3660677.1 inorganic diphosphatase [Paraburkholderia terrae]
MNFNLIEAGENLPHEVNAVIEIPAQSTPVKYEAEKRLGLLKVDRIMSSGMRYPQNYGFVPRTLARDGDPLDIIVFTPFPLAQLCLIACRPVGLLNMTDQAGPDEKIIAVPLDSVCPATTHVMKLLDLGQHALDELEFFFKHYKALEPGKWVRFEGWGDVHDAVKAIESAAEAFVEHEKRHLNRQD